MSEFQTTEELLAQDTKLVEVELMLTVEELQRYAAYCLEKEIKFNDWIRELADRELSCV